MSIRLKTPLATSVEVEEIALFSRYADDWWNPEGVFKPLHRLNPVRIAYIRDQVCAHYKREADSLHSLKGLEILDVGCGGGLLAEPLARIGAKVTGLDASEEGIAVARQHAKAGGVAVNYQAGSVEEWAAQKTRYDIITALEIVEHVADVDLFVTSLATLLKPNGLLIMSTPNRTTKSFLLGIVAAEYVLGWVPKGTHHWRKFIRPSELLPRLDKVGLQVTDMTGIIFNPLAYEFQLRRGDLDVNYIVTAVKRG